MEFWGTRASGILPICVNTGKILLGKRNYWVNEPFTWSNFGGAIGLAHGGIKEEVLSPIDNAVKEMQEEIGYNGEMDIIESYVFEKDNFKYYNFLGLVDNEFVPNLYADEHQEVIEAKWFTLDEILNFNDSGEELHFGIKGLLHNSLNQIKKYVK